MKPKRFSPEQVLFLGFLFLSLLLIAADFLRQPVVGFAGYRWFMGGLALLIVGLIVWTWWGGLRGPALVFLVLVFVALTYVAVELNGVHSVTVTMFILLIFMAVPLLGWGSALVMTGASLVVLWTLAFFPIPLSLPSPFVQARNMTLIFGGVFLLVWWYSRRLRQTNNQLENRVEERTQQVLVSEKLATVGRFSAGLAHELNSPLGAVTSAHLSANAALRTGLVTVFRDLGRLPDDRRAFLESLVDPILDSPSPGYLPSSQSLRDRRRLMVQWGTEGGLAPAVTETLAAGLAEVPSIGREAFVQLGREADWEFSLRLLESVQTLVKSLDVIGKGAGRMALVVRSFQNLSRKDSETDAVPLSPVEELESVLVLLQSRIPQTVEVRRVYHDEVFLFCRPDRLGQVLINLVTNALQAMDYRGILELVVRIDQSEGVIEVVDTGPGVPLGLREKIFEPFFTTKAPGDGNGLGLDLSRRICVEEGGSLSLEQEPGRTRFVIRLPLGRQGVTP